jgi:hypothetical protein
MRHIIAQLHDQDRQEKVEQHLELTCCDDCPHTRCLREVKDLTDPE